MGRLSRITVALVSSGLLFIAGRAGAIAATATATPARPAAGDVTEFALPAGTGGDAIAAGADGNVWFAGGDAIGRITPAGEVATFALHDGYTWEGGIAGGADGNVWFSEAPPAIGRITPDGVITDFPLGEDHFYPHQIAVGSGGVWFVANGHTIGRLVDGQVTLFRMPGRSYANAITLGPDGNMWFTAARPPAVGRIDGAGAIVMFPTGGYIREVGNAITTGPDGRLWFTTEHGHDRIVSISTDGTFGPAYSPESNPNPFGIATGADGNLWFVGSDGAVVTRMGVDGTMQDYTVPGGQYQTEDRIALGPDGNLWLPDYVGNGQHVIVRVTDDPAPALDVEPASGPPGTRVTVRGSGFGALEVVKIVFVDSHSGRIRRAVLHADPMGEFGRNTRVPRGATVGDQSFEAVGTVSGLRASAIFVVT